MADHDTELLELCQDFLDVERSDEFIFKELKINRADDASDLIHRADNSDHALSEMIEASVVTLVSEALDAVKHSRKDGMSGVILVNVSQASPAQITVDTYSSTGGIAQRQGCEAKITVEGDIEIL